MTRQPQMLDWVYRPPNDRALHFYDPNRNWVPVDYSELAATTLDVAHGLVDVGISPGDVVAVAEPTGPGLVAAICATMLAGATVCVLPTPMAMQDLRRLGVQVSSLLRVSAPTLVLCSDEVAPWVTPLAGDGRRVMTTTALASTSRYGDLPGASDVPLLQFTSGSSGTQRGVLISAAALDANHRGLNKALEFTPHDAIVSWLPNHHDMGLIGLLLGSLHEMCDGYFMQPHHFIRRPLDYVRCISERGASITAMPNFGLELLCRRLSGSALAGLDLSSLRAIIVGAERVQPSVINRFRSKFAPHGLSPLSLCPAYGSAEATLAVSLSRPNAGIRAAAPADLGSVSDVVSCGPALPGVQIAVRDPQGAELSDGQVGEIVVRGPSVADRYLGDRAERQASIQAVDGWLNTGDAGFMDGGELFVIGRYGDAVKVRGRTVFAEDLETEVVERGVPADTVTVLLGTLQDALVVFLFTSHAEHHHQLARDLVLERVGDVEVRTHDVESGWILRTSSGKPRRRDLWRHLMAIDRTATVPAVTGSGASS